MESRINVWKLRGSESWLRMWKAKLLKKIG